jgi:hypothetical protein
MRTAVFESGYTRDSGLILPCLFVAAPLTFDMDL